MAKSKSHTKSQQEPGYTRSGARRTGDDYQDLAAIEMFLQQLSDPSQFSYFRLEANEYGTLDDVVGVRPNGSLILKQVKFTVDADNYKLS